MEEFKVNNTKNFSEKGEIFVARTYFFNPCENATNVKKSIEKTVNSFDSRKVLATVSEEKLTYFDEEVAVTTDEPVVETVEQVEEPVGEPVEQVEEPVQEPIEEPVGEPVEEPAEEPVQEEIKIEPVKQDSVPKHNKKNQKIDCYVKKVTRIILNIDQIVENFDGDQVVTVEMMKEKGLVPRQAKYVKVLARGAVKKPIMVEADLFSADAIREIELAGGKAIIKGDRKKA